VLPFITRELFAQIRMKPILGAQGMKPSST
jgi:hypothetical protein